MTSGDFRAYLFAPDDPRVASIRGLNAREYAEAAKSDPFPAGLIAGWSKLYPEPFYGVTNDGTLLRGLYRVEKPELSDSAPTAAMVAAARAFVDALSGAQRASVSYPIDAHEWRSWANPEFMQHDTGLRLDEINSELRDAVLRIVEASLSRRGYELVRNCMRINGFLGDVVDLPLLMNEFSYNFAIFGMPSMSDPWGWQFFGHHVALNCLVLGGQMVISPVFLGAEPDTIDEGEFAGLRVFDKRIETARTLMATLPPAQQQRARIYKQMVDPEMPPGRVHPGDGLHLAGCFQDNRVIPYEGVNVSDMPPAQRHLVSKLLTDFMSYLPDGPATVRLREIERFYAETWFSWIGGGAPGEPFYFRLQSPVVIAELDHHTGVFLNNEEPAAFHIHTVVRTPNGNDYGRILVESALGRPLAP